MRAVNLLPRDEGPQELFEENRGVVFRGRRRHGPDHSRSPCTLMLGAGGTIKDQRATSQFAAGRARGAAGRVRVRRGASQDCDPELGSRKTASHRRPVERAHRAVWPGTACSAKSKVLPEDVWLASLNQRPRPNRRPRSGGLSPTAGPRQRSSGTRCTRRAASRAFLSRLAVVPALIPGVASESSLTSDARLAEARSVHDPRPGEDPGPHKRKLPSAGALRRRRRSRCSSTRSSCWFVLVSSQACAEACEAEGRGRRPTEVGGRGRPQLGRARSGRRLAADHGCGHLPRRQGDAVRAGHAGDPPRARMPLAEESGIVFESITSRGCRPPAPATRWCRSR